MKNSIFTLIILTSLLSINAYAQNNLWTWMHGDTTTNNIGIYGTQGISSPSNKPGSRTRAVSWTDKNGNLWLFGGLGCASTYTVDILNDLWKYDPSINEWTWMNGDNTTNNLGIYGTQGIPSVSNKPGSRYNAASWVDTSGNFWLFGGLGYTSQNACWLNDLWMYNPNTNEWTWIRDCYDTPLNYGIYGIMGVPDTNNIPGNRHGKPVCWTDSNNNLWLFGGSGYDINGDWPDLGDLWKYNISTNKWTWMHGYQTVYNFSVYGLLGIPNSNNKPGCRYWSNGWTDQLGNLYLFGGYSLIDNLNDLWKFDPTINEWTWIKGDTSFGNPGIYGSIGVPDSSNKPGCRSAAITLTDKGGNAWLFGGWGMASTMSTEYLNDLWEYQHGTNTWTWISGDNTTGNISIFGIQGVPNPSNKPGARFLSVGWIDENDCIWIFGGGNSFGNLNDLWRFCPDSITNIEVNTNDNLQRISLYPNPFKNKIIIKIVNSSSDNYGFRLLDILGREVKIINNIKQDKYEIDCSNLANGAYIYYVMSKNKIVKSGRIFK